MRNPTLKVAGFHLHLPGRFSLPADTVITLLMTAVALVACFVPALRAAKVDPLVALRCE